eukprot:5250065-Lingulodinium_polyedra.AAC.1
MEAPDLLDPVSKGVERGAAIMTQIRNARGERPRAPGGTRPQGGQQPLPQAAGATARAASEFIQNATDGRQ